MSVSYLNNLLEKDTDGNLFRNGNKIYDKRDDLNFSILNFPYLCSNMPSIPSCWVYVSQLIRYTCTRACSTYVQFIMRCKRRKDNLLKQEYQELRLKLSLRKFFVVTMTLSANMIFL